jgi:regulator of protease activity HflC (stomatin/prohibitin superfamily)
MDLHKFSDHASSGDGGVTLDIRKWITYAMFFVPAVLLLIFVSNCVTRIGPGRVGIKVDLAGSQRGVEDLPIRTGWVFYNFLTSTVVEYPTSIQTAKWTRDMNEGAPTNEEMSFNTQDGLTVYGDLSVSYHLDSSKVPQFYVKFRSDNIEQFTHGFLRNVARDSINRTGSQYTVQEIMGEKKSELELKSRMDLQAQVNDIGVEIDQFGFIGSPRPPQSVIDSINAKVQAQQIAVQKQNELVQAQADAAKTVAAAEGQAKAQIAIANGEAESNRLRAASISENIIKWQQLAVTDRWIEKWNGAMPSVQSGGGAPPGLLLDVKP